MNVPWTLEQAQSSNDIMFLERSSADVVATRIAAGDFRSAAGFRTNDDRYWVGAYATPGIPQTTTGAAFGGVQTVYTLGTNRLMLDYIHAGVNKLATNGITLTGATIDAVAVRTQIAF
jgi:phosphate-selective porin O/P